MRRGTDANKPGGPRAVCEGIRPFGPQQGDALEYDPGVFELPHRGEQGRRRGRTRNENYTKVWLFALSNIDGSLPGGFGWLLRSSLLKLFRPGRRCRYLDAFHENHETYLPALSAARAGSGRPAGR
ncbi:hypothetical protein GCM10009533_61580 [Saccharopolyspora spinosporotrichia]|uniref:Uncharacterized protein n=1 Tax=Saccharopolyspora erythraea TaxID=1836 RepID=A0ABN1DYC8_SACER